MSKKICSIEWCENPVFSRGLCNSHYKRWWRHGDPLAGRTPNGEPLKWIDTVALKFDGNECLTWPFNRKGDGYARMTVNGRPSMATRYVCELVNGPPPTRWHQAAHTCGKGHEGCINPKHLKWKTRAENELDKIIHGTSNRGERQGCSKLTADQVLSIRKLGRTQLQEDIADKFGVTAKTISDIILRKRWTWLGDS